MKDLQVTIRNDKYGKPRLYPACDVSREFVKKITKTRTVTDNAYIWLRSQGFTITVVKEAVEPKLSPLQAEIERLKAENAKLAATPTAPTQPIPAGLSALLGK